PLLLFPVELFVFILLAYCLLKFFPTVMRYIQREKSEVSEFMIIILVGLLIATFSEFLGLGTIIGALIAGIILQVSIRDRGEEQILVNDLRIITLGLIVPFFFISIGLNFSVASLFTNPVLLLSILVVATAGKIIGAMLAKPFTDLSWRQLYVVGWGMNSRGAVELVIAFVARPFIPADVFSSIVVMAVVTTILSMLMIERQTQKDRGIMG
ncbi:MAG: cation:proton antiporter, partial [Candidatus Altiarchaeota archaeon]|nr:cation:proton antiporter [Candidatus Altiarchaeota archaeon]MBU4436906.1 cation:proton antiporter [Candidatus Altiarchaeota archaeon]